jgi:hypothetical protein
MAKKQESSDSRYRKKPSHKGKRGKRGEGLIYDERKQKLNLTITPTGIARLDAKAKEEDCSISTLIEEFARSPLLDSFHIENKFPIKPVNGD